MTRAAEPKRAETLLVITSLWPTADRPGTGTFVKDRIRGQRAVVIRADSYSGSTAIRYLGLAWRALTVRGRFYGVEAHVLFPAGLIGLVAATIRRVPLVVYAHGADVRVAAHRNLVNRLLSSLVVNRAGAVVTNSAATAALVSRLGRAPDIVSPGVDLDRFHPSPRPVQRRVLYLGGDRYHKGYDRAVGIADTLVGPLLHEVAPDEVAGLIAAHDIVLVPSRAEPFGLAAAEAIASGRWVVAADVDGLREVVTNGLNGTLVQDQEFAEAVQRVPDYDPFKVARTAERFRLETHQRAMAAIWERVRARKEGRSERRSGCSVTDCRWHLLIPLSCRSRRSAASGGWLVSRRSTASLGPLARHLRSSPCRS